MNTRPTLLALSLTAILLSQPALAQKSDRDRARPPVGNEERAHMPPWLKDGDRPGGERPYLQRWMNTVKEENPEDFQRLQKMREDDPDAFRKELQQRLKNKGRGGPDGFKKSSMGDHVRSEKLRALEKQHMTLAKQIRKADGEDRDQLIAELRTSLGDAFDERESLRTKQLEHMKKELERHETMAQQRLENRDRIIEEHIDRLTTEKKPEESPID